MDPFEHLESLGQFKLKPGLERINHILEMLEKPHLEVPSVHITGTNGKGSTALMVECIMSEFGLSSGLYTSPHLYDVTERIRFDGKDVERSVLGDAIERIMRMEEGTDDGLTYFEMLTACYFLLSRERSVDASVVEVGLGGRWDATNVVQPHASAITSISLDHVQHLGDDVLSIAKEKAGIIKPSTPVVIGIVCRGAPERIPCLELLLTQCDRNGCPVVVITEPEEIGALMELVESFGLPDHRLIEVRSRTLENGVEAELKVVRGRGNGDPCFEMLDEIAGGKYFIPVIGEHQALNAACAVPLSLLLLPVSLAKRRLEEGVLEDLSNLVQSCPDEIWKAFSKEDVKEKIAVGLTRLKVPGRMEILEEGGKTLILDGGHNEEAAVSISNAVCSHFEGRRIRLLFSMMADKDGRRFASGLRLPIESMNLVELPYQRGMGMRGLLSAVSAGLPSDPDIHAFDRFDEGIREWLVSIDPDRDVGLACGSFYLIKMIKDVLGLQKV
ncbi:MAG: bifunctional folylpolyglutamate synthase/dihydrofolate synthase [Thermoplasmatota archaeon]